MENKDTIWHAHIYYTAETLPSVKHLLTDIEKVIPVKLGRFRDEPVGPHPTSMIQVAFAEQDLQALVLLLSKIRPTDLSVLVHPETGYFKPDHLERSFWFGKQLSLNIPVD